MTAILTALYYLALGIVWVTVALCGIVTICGFVWLIWCWAKSFRSDDAADYTNPRGWWI